MFAQITCPKCQTMGQFTVFDGNYKGPYLCWKCRAAFSVEISNAKLVFCQSISEADFEAWKAKEDAKNNGPRHSQASQPAESGK